MNFEKAIEIDPEKIYVLEANQYLPLEAVMSIQKIWKEGTGGKSPIVLTAGIKIARHDEGSIRQRLANELEERAKVRDAQLQEDVESIAMAKEYFLESARIGQMHKDAQWLRGETQ